jgi:hypothetical protein
VWRVQIHIFVLFFPHGAHSRELVSSQAARAISGTWCQTGLVGIRYIELYASTKFRRAMCAPELASHAPGTRAMSDVRTQLGKFAEYQMDCLLHATIGILFQR